MALRTIIQALALLLCISSLASAQTIASAFDASAPDTSCDVANGYSPPRLRNCYVPSWQGTFAPSHGDLAFSVAITLAAPTLIEATYHQVAYVNSQQWGAGAQYSVAIGVDSTTAPCGVAPGLVFDTLGELSGELTAICVVTLPAGSHVIYALEAARVGAFAYHGQGNQQLTVRYQR